MKPLHLYKAAVIVMGIFVSVGLYGTLRTADIEPLRSVAICIPYGIGFYHILTTFGKGIFYERKDNTNRTH